MLDRRDPHGRVNAFVMADGIADTSANVFNQIKIRIADDPDNDPNAVMVEAKVDENVPPDAEGFVEFTIATDDVDFRVYYPRPDPIDFETEEDTRGAEMGSSSYDENMQDAVMTSDQSDQSEGSVLADEEMSNNHVFRSLSTSSQGDDGDIAGHGVVDQGIGGTPRFCHPTARALVLGKGMKDDLPGGDKMDGKLAQDARIALRVTPADKEPSEEHDSSSDTAYSSATFQPMDLDGADDSDSDYAEEPQDASTATEKKGKNKASPESRYENSLWFVIMDKDKPNGPPKYYKCKIARCNGFQGTWNSRKKHFQAKHTEEWIAATGSRPKFYECPMDDCDYATIEKRSINNHRKNHHGLGPIEDKK